MNPDDVVIDQELIIRDDFWERNMQKHMMTFKSENPGAVWIGVESVRMEANGLVITARWKVPR